MKEIWVYDIEVYPNLFVFNAINWKTSERKSWVLRDSQKFNDINSLRNFYLDKSRYFVGFNSLSYDHPVTLKILRTHNLSTKKIKSISDSIFGKKIVVDNPRMIDLFKIMHFDNFAKSTSLKNIEGVIRWKDLRELPYDPNKFLSKEEQDEVIEYCWNDVLATSCFFDEVKEKVRFHFSAKKKYGLKSHNISDSLMGELIVAKAYEKSTGKKFKGSSPRDVIKFGDLIAPYVSFDTPKLQKLLERISNTVLYRNTKGEYRDKQGKKFEYKISLGNKTYKLGVGGLHSIDSWGDYSSKDGKILSDRDVASLYPSLIINLGLYPEHLGEELLKEYTRLKETRLYHKANRYNKSIPLEEQLEHRLISDALKIALNSVYGKSNSEYSALYDPRVTYATTINGQLSLLMLIEKTLHLNPISANTDGVLYHCDAEKLSELDEICNSWEKSTNLELEEVRYDRYYCRDVNNYIAILPDGSSKEKGAYEIDKKLGGVTQYHKDHSMRIIPIAIKEYLISGTPIEETITNHKDIYDFCLLIRAKKTEKKGDSHFVLDKPEGIEKHGKYLRTFASNWKDAYSGKLKKLFADGTSIDLYHQHSFTVFNKAFDVDLSSIDRTFYIKEARKLMFNQLSLF